jgi:hypothetical protein
MGIPTSAGSVSRCGNEFRAGVGHAKTSGGPFSLFFAFFAASREISFHRRDGSREAAKKAGAVGPLFGEDLAGE